MSGNKRLAVLTDARELRSRWLAASTRLVEGCLRSPVFLSWLRYSLTAATRGQLLYTGARREPAPRGSTARP